MNIKKITVFTLCALSALSLAACNKKETTKSNTTTNVVTTKANATTKSNNTTAKKNTTTKAETTEGQVSKEAWGKAFNYYFNISNRNFTFDVKYKSGIVEQYTTRVVNEKSIVAPAGAPKTQYMYSTWIDGVAIEKIPLGINIKETETTLSFDKFLGNYKNFAEKYDYATFDASKKLYKFSYDVNEYEVEFNSDGTIKCLAMISGDGFTHNFSNYGTTKIDDYEEINIITPTKYSMASGSTTIDYFQYTGNFGVGKYLVSLDLSLAPNIFVDGLNPIIALSDSMHTSHITSAAIALNGKMLSNTDYSIHEYKLIKFSDTLKLSSKDKLFILFGTDITEEGSYTLSVESIAV